MLKKPELGLCPDYYFTYIELVREDEDVLAALSTEVRRTRELLGDLPESAGDIRYAEGKWSLRESLGHVIDAERVFAYRAFAMGRGDTQPIPGMDQDAYAEVSNAGARAITALLDEFEAVRGASLALFRSFDASAWERRGTASGFEFAVGTFPYIVLGHERHHRGLFLERYLPLVGGDS